MAYDAFLKLDGLTGESTDDKHKGEVELKFWSFGVDHKQTIGSATGGAGSGKAAFNALIVEKVVDKASPVLFQNCASGDHFKTGVLTLRKAGGTQLEYLKWNLDTVFVTNVDFSSNTADEVVTERVHLAKASVDYQAQGADGKPMGGPVHGGWDILTNKKY